ncbi:MAG: DUF2851 family protein, partial [Bacteroidetes bacterium]|nr:DUF2851 family protein [Bacteroidota bacterium]
MHEEFIYYLWKNNFIGQSPLRSTQNEKIKIINPGDRNDDAGPDFFNAKIRIGKTLWAGNVEIHVKSSDWTVHKHNLNKAYDNIILHVVHEADKRIFRSNGEEIPTLEIRNSFDQHLLRSYQSLIKSGKWLPCQDYVSKVNPIIVNNWLERMSVERLEDRSKLIMNDLKKSKNNWEEVFYIHLAKNFGFNVNGLPFELLAKSIPFKIMRSKSYETFQIEACLFGQSGLLDNIFHDHYPNELIREYNHLQNKHSLKPLQKHLWKLSRMRPNNFPTIRISQFAALLAKEKNLFNSIMDKCELKHI